MSDELDPDLWDEACRIYGFVGAVDPVTLSPQQRLIIDSAYDALDERDATIELLCMALGEALLANTESGRLLAIAHAAEALGDAMNNCQDCDAEFRALWAALDARRATMANARVFYRTEEQAAAEPGGLAAGWYFQMEGCEPLGPYDSPVHAGTAARDEIVGAGGGDPSGCRWTRGSNGKN